MVKKMLIDATHEEEVRLSVVAGNKLEEFDFETNSKRQIKGNVYLAQVTRVEPSLQAAFVEYGGSRQGFLPFSEIHPDYYQIPVEDRQLEEQTVDYDDDDIIETNGDMEVENLGDDREEVEVQSRKSRPRLKRHYKIQEVIKNRQVVLVQAVKEERGNKGAAMTTYLSLAGRYCVLMPNSSRGGGVSRKITSGQDRSRLKEMLKQLGEGKAGGVIVRTAGAGRTKVEIKRDYRYIYNLWDKIREKTLKSIAPEMIYEEAGLVNRAIRDIYNSDIDEIIVAGDNGYKAAKDYMKDLIPSHAKKVQKYKEESGIPLFQRYQVESQISHIYDSQVYLPSGGSIVLQQTEALVAIDVNSGRSIGERNVDATALKTNLEAAEEVARQLRLRDMAGLIVIDFIDMEDRKLNISVERKLKESLNIDRARIQVGRISQFGLLEMSRQRLRPSLIDASSSSCPSCGGSGMIPNLEVSAMATLRSVEEEVFRKRSAQIRVTVPTDVGFYLLNNKRRNLAQLEQDFGIHIALQVSDDFVAPKYEMVRIDEDGNAIVVGAASENNKSTRGRPRKKAPVSDRNKSTRNNRRSTGKKSVNTVAHKTDTADVDSAETVENTATDKPRGRPPKSKGRKFWANRQKTDKTSSENPSAGNKPVEKHLPDAGETPSETPRKKGKKGKTKAKKSVDTRTTGKDTRQSGSSDVQANTIKPVASVENTPADDTKTPVKKTRAKKASTKKATAKKTSAKKATAKKAVAKKAVAKKASAKKTAVKKASAKKATAKKTSTKKASVKKATAKKVSTKKAVAKKQPAKASATKTTNTSDTSVATERKGWWS